MRIVIGLVVIIVLGGILTAAYTIQPARLNPAQVTELQSNCAQCHSIPPVKSRDQVHNAHRFLECSTCHSGATTSGDEDENEGGAVNNSICARCHSVPKYSSAAELHNSHNAAECAICHESNTGLATATNVHSAIRAAGIGLMVLGIVGLIVNFIIAKSKLKKQR
jgi:hypothetical protein